MEEDLDQLECPFTWHIPHFDYDFLMKKLDENRDQSCFLINGFCYMIYECFERSRGNHFEQALSVLKECELALTEYTPVGKFALEDKNLLEKCSEALWHVLYSTEAYLSYKNNNMAKTEEILNKITSAKSLDEANSAGMLAVKSRILMIYGPFQTEKAIDFMRKAIKLDDTVPLWHHLLGKCIARYRRAKDFAGSDPNEEEINELDKAWKMIKRPDYGVSLLQSYQNYDYNKPTNATLKMKIPVLISDVEKAAGEEWYIYARLAHIVMRLPWIDNQKNYAKKLINLADKYYTTSLTQNDEENQSFLAIVKCYYYSRFEKNLEKTRKFGLIAAKNAGDIGSIAITIRLSYQIETERNLVPLFDQFLDLLDIEKSETRNNLMIFKANYLMFVKNNFEEAFKIYLEIMTEKNNYKLLKRCQPLFNEVKYWNYSVLEKLKTVLKDNRRFATPEEKSLSNNVLDQLELFENQNKTTVNE